MSEINSTTIQVGSSPTATNNFVFQTDGAGGMTLKNGAGTSVMSVDSAGNISLPKPPSIPTNPALSVKSSASQTGLTATQVISVLDTKVASDCFDTIGAFNNTASPTTLNGISVPAYSYLPNVAGYYQVNVIAVFGTSAITYAHLWLYKNGGNYKNVYMRPNTIDFGLAISALVYFNGTSDYISVYVGALATAPLAAAGVTLSAVLVARS